MVLISDGRSEHVACKTGILGEKTALDQIRETASYVRAYF